MKRSKSLKNFWKVERTKYYESIKVGYIFISVDIKRGTAGDWDTWVVKTAEELLDKILYEFVADILENSGHVIAPPCEASKIAREEIER